MDLFEVPALICSAELYEFPVAAVTSGHTLSGLKQHAFILLKFWGSESAMRQQGCVPSGGSGGESSPCLCHMGVKIAKKQINAVKYFVISFALKFSLLFMKMEKCPFAG